MENVISLTSTTRAMPRPSAQSMGHHLTPGADIRHDSMSGEGSAGKSASEGFSSAARCASDANAASILVRHHKPRPAGCSAPQHLLVFSDSPNKLADQTFMVGNTQETIRRIGHHWHRLSYVQRRPPAIRTECTCYVARTSGSSASLSPPTDQQLRFF